MKLATRSSSTLCERAMVRAFFCCLFAVVVTAWSVDLAMAQGIEKPLAFATGSGETLQLSPNESAEAWILTVTGPEGFSSRHEFVGGQSPSFSAAGLAPGSYSYTLTAKRREAGANTQSGAFTVGEGGISQVQQPDPISPVGEGGPWWDGREVGATRMESSEDAAEDSNGCANGEGLCEAENGPDVDAAQADQGSGVAAPFRVDAAVLTTGNESIHNSLCVGSDCLANESYGFDTIKLKENNLRIRFDDTSNTLSFPLTDWQITINDSSNGGASYFGINDLTANRSVFRVAAGARSNALVVDSQGDLGLGTLSPALDIDVKTGNTPSIRLQQDNTSGFTPQSWDISGNEANFFIRDATNGSRLPFRIQPAAPTDSVFIASDGDIGLGTASPSAPLHVRRTNGNAAVLVEETSGTVTNRTMLELRNNGPVYYMMRDDDAAVTWFQQAHSNRYLITKSGSGDQELELYDDGRFIIGDGGTDNLNLDGSGNLTINGTLTQLSTRAAKENLSLTTGGMLDKIASLPVYEWNYSDQGPGVRHLGPMAEDFWQAFGYAGDDRHMAPSDLAAVALVAVQELARIVELQQTQLVGYRTAIRDLGGDPDAAVAAAGDSAGVPLAAGIVGGTDVEDAASTAEPPRGFEPERAEYTNEVDSPLLRSLERAMVATEGTLEDPRNVVRVYKNYDAWWGENRDEATLSAMGQSRGYDWFVHDVSALWPGIPEDTNVAIITSASSGDHLNQITHQNGPVAQASLDAFVRSGGTLVVGLADNDAVAGYQVPGAEGTPALVMSDCGGATLGNALYGEDRLAGTADDHALLMGPDGIPASADDLTPFDVGLGGGCYVAHGNLNEGFELPEGARILMTANFGGLQAPVLAEYPSGDGHVLVTTLTMEYLEHAPRGSGASKFLTNLFSYALNGDFDGDEPQPGDERPTKTPGGGSEGAGG